MKLLYCSVHMKDGDFERVFKANHARIENVAQKFHSLLAEGISLNQGRPLTVLSYPPTQRLWLRLWCKSKNIVFYYLPILPIPVVGKLIAGLYLLIGGGCWILRNVLEKRIVVISATQLIKFFPIYLLAKLTNTKLLLVTCDIPRMTFLQRVNGDTKFSVKTRVYHLLTKWLWKITQNFDYYVFLTKQMNPIINKANRKHVIIEGFSDLRQMKRENLLENKYDKFVIVYAGGLYEKYGVRLLVEAVEELDDENVELWLLGTGEMDSFLRRSEYKHVKYLGVKLNKEVLEIEERASLLVNPRFSSEEYTEYSFPSKVIEYMSTGTLSLITRLKGIPYEYFEYCEVIEEETIKGIKSAILNVLQMNPKDRHNKGLEAKAFVLKQKNNKIQSRKILEMIQ